MVRDELKMPSDLEGDYDDEKKGVEGLFPGDNQGSFSGDYDEEVPSKSNKGKGKDSLDEEAQMDGLTKESRSAERSSKKRKIKTSAHNRLI